MCNTTKVILATITHNLIKLSSMSHKDSNYKQQISQMLKAKDTHFNQNIY